MTHHQFEKSFYEYLMTERGNSSNPELAEFAESVFNDVNFPKPSKSYEELTNYFELSTDYLESMNIFDHAWQIYVAQHDTNL